MKPFTERATKILAGIFLVYGILVATHLGEFWPFSIYPMFSQAGNPWTRTLVQDVTQNQDERIWQTTNLENLHGPPVALQSIDINTIDFSDFVTKTDVWDKNRKQTLLQKFPADSLRKNRWMITKVVGGLTDTDSVVIEAIPFLLITDDSVFTNPTLPGHLYNSQQ